ncbi:MAG TPA: CBO0543 family protein [Chondromyces sp.]|nr:CBO0543 family protein [Chondromyces sp.]
MLLMILTIIVFNIVLYFIPKKLSGIEMYTTSLFAIVLQLTIDMILDVKYGLYGYFSAKVVSLEAFGATFGIYPAVNIAFLNFYPFHQTFVRKSLYIVVWSGFAVLYEWLAIYTDFFYYHGWKLTYSALLYPVLYLILLGNYHFIKSLKK